MNRTQLAARILAFGCFAFIVFVTLSPIGLRPVVTGIQTEHVVAFAVVGALFGVGFARHLLLAAALVIAAAIGLEALQNLAPGRHGRLVDMNMKIVGAVLGFAVAAMWNRLQQRKRRTALANAS